MQKDEYLKIRELINNKKPALPEDIPEKGLRNEINNIISGKIEINDDMLKNIINDAFSTNVVIKKKYPESKDAFDLYDKADEIYKNRKRQISEVYNTVLTSLWIAIVLAEVDELICKKDDEVVVKKCQ